MPRFFIAAMLAAILTGLCFTPMSPSRAAQPMEIAAKLSNDKAGQGAGAEKEDDDDDEKEELSPEQKMQRRFPQAVRVGDLLGLAILDQGDSTIGYVRDVVRSPEGRVFLIVPYSNWFGWAPVNWGKRPVAVPIEVVAILARQLNALDMSREDFDEAPTWEQSQGKAISRTEKTPVALGRR